ncbi:unnamed protein product [Chrysodeixis includens]|uniref:Uncharacterized protein n=1 Tax=Chrysodeixis includens TaxID=689277 RepID=A0A9N8KVK6_CHRIL|nr:unnamed protein product [Chrysodeixis includens]
MMLFLSEDARHKDIFSFHYLESPQHSYFRLSLLLYLNICSLFLFYLQLPSYFPCLVLHIYFHYPSSFSHCLSFLSSVHPPQGSRFSWPHSRLLWNYYYRYFVFVSLRLRTLFLVLFLNLVLAKYINYLDKLQVGNFFQ